MRFFVTLIILLFSANSAFAEFKRETSFDDRSICEKNGGVWQEFGDDCMDSCLAKFQELRICNNSDSYGCNCGEGRCFDGGQCVLISDYEKTYKEDLAKEKERLKKERAERAAESEAVARQISSKLIQDTQGRAMSIDIEGAANNYADFYKGIISQAIDNQTQNVKDASNAVQKSMKKIEQNSVQNNVNNQTVSEVIPPAAPPIVIDSGNAKVPPAFLQSEEEKKQQQNQVPEGLPVIPLPTITK